MTREEHAQIFADRLNMMKNDRDLTFREISLAIGVPHSSICRWTLGKALPNAYSLAKLAEYLGVSADWLLGLSDEMGREA